MNADVAAARELLARHCTPAEIDVLVGAAWRCPPRTDITPTEAVVGLALAIEQSPKLKPLFLERAEMCVDDQKRVDALADWARCYGSHIADAAEFYAALVEFLRQLWPHAHESRLCGAMMVGACGTQMYPMQLVRCMRDTEGGHVR